MIVKQQHKLDEVSYHKLFDILKKYQNEVNELRVERLARNANPLALVATAQANQDLYYQTSRFHKSYAPSSKPSIPTRSHTTTTHKGKDIAKTITPPSETASEEDINPEQAQRDKDMQKNLVLIAKYFKKIYKPTNNNLRTSSKSRNKHVDTTPWYKNDDHSGQFGNQRTVNVAGAREKVGSPVVQQSGIQCFNCKEFGHFAKECRKPKRVKDFTYHKEKMLLCKQDKKGVPLQAEHYMAKIQEVPTADSGIDSEPVEQVQNDVGYNVLANDLQHSEQSESISNTCLVETNDSNVTPDSPDMCEDDIQNDQKDVESDDECVVLSNLIANLKLDVDENKKIQKQLKKANTTLAQELKECKVILVETSKSLGESISVRGSCLVALQTKQTEFEKYKAFNDRTVDYDCNNPLFQDKHHTYSRLSRFFSSKSRRSFKSKTLLMEGEITVICVDTSITNLCLFHDQIHAVEIYCERKLNAHPDNLVGIVTSSEVDFGSCLAPPTNSMETVTSSLNDLDAGEQVYQYIDAALLRGFTFFRLALFGQEDRKKRIVVFSGGPLLSTTGHSPEAMGFFLKEGRVVLDVINFGTQVKDKKDFKAKYLKVLVDASNDNNENEASRYFLIDDTRFSLSRQISSSSILPPLVSHSRTSMSSMEGEVIMICVDTSITSLCCFHDQIDAVKIYCERKLKAHPDNLVSIARFGLRDLGICLDPTNRLERVTYKLGCLQPLKQEYTDLLQGFKLFHLGLFGQEDMKKRIVVFSGGPLLSTTGHSPEAMAFFLKEGRLVLDVIDFGTRVKGKEDCKAKYLKALVAAVNDNNENEDSHYFLIDDNRFSLSRQISSSSILPPLVPEEEAPISHTRMKTDIHSDEIHLDVVGTSRLLLLILLSCHTCDDLYDSRSSLSRPRPDAVTRTLAPSLDESRRRRFMRPTSSPRFVNNTSSWIWCRSIILSVSSSNEPESCVFPPNVIQVLKS
nr:26S proteasome non-ATPase regulatory subunit 4 homolog [Tanacetum cinerariifolium]